MNPLPIQKQSTFVTPTGASPMPVPNLEPILPLLQRKAHLVLTGPFGVGKDVALNAAMTLPESESYITPRTIREATPDALSRAALGTENDLTGAEYEQFRKAAHELFHGHPTACILYSQDPAEVADRHNPSPILIQVGRNSSVVTMTFHQQDTEQSSDTRPIASTPHEVIAIRELKNNMSECLGRVQSGTALKVVNLKQNKTMGMLSPVPK